MHRDRGLFLENGLCSGHLVVGHYQHIYPLLYGRRPFAENNPVFRCKSPSNTYDVKLLVPYRPVVFVTTFDSPGIIAL